MLALRAIAALALCMSVEQANAQAECPQLSRLLREASMAGKGLIGLQTPDRCDDHNRFVIAWSAIVLYADVHRVSCNITDAILDQFEKRHRDAARTRDNVCAGRLLSPPEIVRPSTGRRAMNSLSLFDATF